MGLRYIKFFLSISFNLNAFLFSDSRWWWALMISLQVARVNTKPGERRLRRYFKLFRSPGIDSKESNTPAYVACMAGRYDNPLLTQFLAPIFNQNIWPSFSRKRSWILFFFFKHFYFLPWLKALAWFFYTNRSLANFFKICLSFIVTLRPPLSVILTSTRRQRTTTTLSSPWPTLSHSTTVSFLSASPPPQITTTSKQDD
jgi:hypothetical protein